MPFPAFLGLPARMADDAASTTQDAESVPERNENADLDSLLNRITDMTPYDLAPSSSRDSLLTLGADASDGMSLARSILAADSASVAASVPASDAASVVSSVSGMTEDSRRLSGG
jgi:hypothetical protein